MGGDPLALGAWLGRSIDLTSCLFMAAYPVTVAQFQAFIDAGGYTERWGALWSSIGGGVFRNETSLLTRQARFACL
jgi:formylglycine-generating enzyme required for sulfatase activity